MSQDKLKKMKCPCGFQGYRTTRRIKGENLEKLSLKKFCKKCKKTTEHKEMKK